MSNPTLPNRKSAYQNVEEEREAYWQLGEAKLKVLLQNLPSLLRKLDRIPDPRRLNSVKHKITVLMLYGILMFVFQLSSKRRANRVLTAPQLIENLKVLYPELTTMPHQETLSRFLAVIEVHRIEEIYLDLLNELIRKKKFRHMLSQGRYLIAIDGTQKYKMGTCDDERYLRRKVGPNEYQYYSYVLEAVLIFSNGMVLPLMSEFLENTPELEAIDNEEEWKQDCELKAFYRLAKRLKERFPRLRITLLLDGLYANGPVLRLCKKNNWQYMIVLKDKSLPTVWEEVNGLMKLDTNGENSKTRIRNGVEQKFRWVNEIEYGHKQGSKTHYLKIHVVICEEKRLVASKDGNAVEKVTRYVWISSEPLDKNNVCGRCNLMGRKRWLHENNILTEKHQGYHYEHIYSHDWNAMQGFHHLMHIAHFLNELVLHSIQVVDYVREMGIRFFLETFRGVMIYQPMPAHLRERLISSPGQLRLVYDDWRRTAA